MKGTLNSGEPDAGKSCTSGSEGGVARNVPETVTRSAPTLHHQYLFAPFRLDLVNEQLWQDEEVVSLRPKLFAVLRHLVEHAGRLVSREALRTAVWPATMVSESVLRGAIRELRDILGDDADIARFVETIPHRGYRFIAPVTMAQSVPVAAPPGRQCASQDASRREQRIFIGRDAELAQLQIWLEKAVQGERQVVFVTGEPGIGKTTVVDAFLTRVTHRSDLWTVRGQCVEHYGASEAYLPILEALGQLCRQPGGERMVSLLSRYAPSWLAQMPGVTSETELEAAQRRVQGMTPERMLRELVEALEALTASTPLVLVLEDLHWSDYATLDLLSALTQRRGAARLLLLGTYRPADMVVSGHPLKALKQELHIHGRCKELPLRLLTDAEVAHYLTARFSQQLPPALGQAIHRSTEGNPLFMINVVDYWVTQQALVETAGQWHLATPVQDLTTGVPESLRQMIERQLERLTPEEQRMIETASVAGVEFSTGAVAAGMEEKRELVEKWCEEFVKREQFLRARGTETAADGQVTGRYGFLHALYQQVLYERVAVVRRVRLHRRLGAWGERAYGARVEEHATELAVHFERGQDFQRAVRYLRHAARHALRRSANREAISLLTTALELLKRLPDTPEHAQQELTLLITLSAPLSTVKGYAAPEVEDLLARTLELCQQVEKSPKLFFVLLRLAGFSMIRGELPTARALGEQCLSLAQSAQDPLFLLWTHYLLGEISFWRGEFSLAQTHLEQGISLYSSQKNSFRTFHGVEDPGVSCLLVSALVHWFLGYPDQALKKQKEALAFAQTLSNPLSLASALHLAGLHHQLRREVQETQEQIEALITLSTDQESSLRLAGGTILQGWVLTEQGQGREKGLALIRQGLTAYHTTGAAVGGPWHLTLLAEACGTLGQTHEGLIALAKASDLADKSEERFYKAELYRLKGELTLKQPSKIESQQSHVPNTPYPTGDIRAEMEAETCFFKAIEISRQQQAKALELRATLSLARLWQQQGKRKQARRMLVDISSWFTEGFDTVDLKEAAALLQALL